MITNTVYRLIEGREDESYRIRCKRGPTRALMDTVPVEEVSLPSLASSDSTLPVGVVHAELDQLTATNHGRALGWLQQGLM